MKKEQLKKLNREELLLEQVRENNELKHQLAQAEEALERREIINKKSGSLAEASLEIVRIFEQADKAAAIYLENIKKNHGKD